jgi:hypothetical protein
MKASDVPFQSLTGSFGFDVVVKKETDKTALWENSGDEDDYGLGGLV